MFSIDRAKLKAANSLNSSVRYICSDAHIFKSLNIIFYDVIHSMLYFYATAVSVFTLSVSAAAVFAAHCSACEHRLTVM